MKKTIISILSICMLVTSFTSGVRAEPVQHEPKENNEITYIAATQNIIKTFSFPNLVSDVTSSPFNVSGSGDIQMSVHQRTANPAHNPLVKYTLKSNKSDNSYEQSIYVSGTFTDTTTIRTFTNVPSGEYRIKIENYGGASNLYGDGRLYR
ncbi:hypothetical protein [Paenibacillus sp. DR312]|uniref:hypothetical protein n=1 Tax=unclassified Paenibacillus TaxID=185978 RepID=UPI001C97FD18|nr:hypothetical protein [Paenibacillus sp. DR312]QZN77389.1 hypothetical protein K5K90_09415 [Paenibacillus sp. DR312]